MSMTKYNERVEVVYIDRLAEELAEDSTQDELLGTEGYLDDEDLYDNYGTEDQEYTKEAQEVYDRYLNYYIDILERNIYKEEN